jgi:hypothetical protein
LLRDARIRIKGVIQCKKTQKWIARIKFKGILFNIFVRLPLKKKRQNLCNLLEKCCMARLQIMA